MVSENKQYIFNKIKNICNLLDPYNDNDINLNNSENILNLNPEYLRYIYYQCDRNNISEKNCQFILNEINNLNN
tara:strand:- start:426 stop:647 length:222 start_codon:yes stop_codon:yes gene_type:complete